MPSTHLTIRDVARLLEAGGGQTPACLAPNLTACMIEGAGPGEALPASPTGRIDRSQIRSKHPDSP